MSPVLATAELDKKHWHSIELGYDRQTGSAIVYFIYSGTSSRADLGTPFPNIYQNLVIEYLDSFDCCSRCLVFSPDSV